MSSAIQKVLRYNKYFFHLLVWGIFFLLSYDYIQNWIPQNKIPATENEILLYVVLYVLLLMVAPYFNYFVLIPRLYVKKKYWLYTTLFFLSWAIICVGKAELDGFFVPSGTPWLFTAGHYISTLPYLLIFTALASWARFSEEWSRKQKEQEELKKAKMEAELKWLKAQINPHFLFNSLNNIHSLVYFKSDEAGPMLVKLSEMMRYILYDCNLDKIPVSKEIHYLTNYIDLQCLKKKRKNKISWTYENLDSSIDVEPMLFINFIENAFKHSNIDRETGWIKISLTTKEGRVNFVTENSFEDMGTKDKTGGIGLVNVKRRLEIIYPGRHKLDIEQANNIYKVELELSEK